MLRNSQGHGSVILLHILLYIVGGGLQKGWFLSFLYDLNGFYLISFSEYIFGT